LNVTSLANVAVGVGIAPPVAPLEPPVVEVETPGTTSDVKLHPVRMSEAAARATLATRAARFAGRRLADVSLPNPMSPFL
jgi:hypothetical protein